MARLGACIVIATAMVCALMASIHLPPKEAESWGDLFALVVIVSFLAWLFGGER